MNVIVNKGVLTDRSGLWSAMVRLFRRSRSAVLLAATIIRLPAFAEKESRDLATFVSGQLPAK